MVQIEIDGGRFPIKRVVGEQVVVEADAFTDGHDVVVCALCYRKGGDTAWREAPMRSLGNDRWQGTFVVAEVGRYTYTVRAWVDRFKTWARDLTKRLEAGQDVAVELLIGAALAEQAIPGAPQKDATRLRAAAELLRAGGDLGVREALSDELAALMSRYPDRRLATTYGTELAVVVDMMVEIGDRGITTDEEATPDERTDGAKANAELVDLRQADDGHTAPHDIRAHIMEHERFIAQGMVSINLGAWQCSAPRLSLARHLQRSPTR
jgi:hypothetical protein